MAMDISFALDTIENETERRQAEKALQESENRYRDLVETSLDGIFINCQDKIVFINRRGLEMLGATEYDQVIGHSPFEIFHADYHLLIRERIKQVLIDQVSVPSTEEKIITLDGRTILVEVTATRVVINGTPSVQVILHDIAERKRAEEKLRQSEERLRLSLQAASQSLFDLNVQTGDAIVNREYAEMLGYDPETFVANNTRWFERLHPDDRESVAKAYLDYVSGLQPNFRIECRQRAKDGSWKWTLSLGRVIEYDQDGRPLRMLGTHTDITEHNPRGRGAACQRGALPQSG